MKQRFDVVIIGSGLAGLTTAYLLASAGKKVVVITKSDLKECNSYYAQGGIAAVFDNSDSVDRHVSDTLIAGDGLCDEFVVREIVEKSKAAIDWLINIGVPFTRDNSSETGYHLTQEGGHGFRRILHVDDATGSSIMNTLVDKIIHHDNIVICEQMLAIDVILHNSKGTVGNQVIGLYAYDAKLDAVITFLTNNLIIASGGAGKCYKYTTNPDVATGDGIALAYRAGCDIANMEFMQFHPTTLYHQDAHSFLISEALRGEGAILKNKANHRFMFDYDNRGELAPRDIVARAIDAEMKVSGEDCVYLDISHKSAEFIQEHFPNIYAKCLTVGLDITRDPIPVVPAAHYTCGGIKTDISGRTNVSGLYAVGECASTGLHGANRLASNSLLECLVLGSNVVQDIIVNSRGSIENSVKLWDESRITDADERVLISHCWDELRAVMWNYVGIVRTNKRLIQALDRVNLIRQEVDEFYSKFRLSRDLIELRNLVDNCSLIINSALLREESRGLHYNLDYPSKSNQLYDIWLNKYQESVKFYRGSTK